MIWRGGMVEHFRMCLNVLKMLFLVMQTLHFIICKHYGNVAFEYFLNILKQVTFKKCWINVQLKYLRKKKHFMNRGFCANIYKT